MRRLSVPAALVAAVLLAGCSPGSSGSAGSPSGSGTPADVESEAAGVGWSPCDDVDAGEVGRYVGQRMTEQTGTVDQPRCAFTPVVKGGPAFDVNYLWFDGGLDRAWRSMGKVEGVVSKIRVPGADAARLVVHARRPAVLVSGFVQTGGLVQSVNAVQLRPYDEQTVVSATRKLLAALAEKAPSR